MKIQVLNTDNLTLPEQGTPKSSGFDIVAAEDPEIVGEQFGDTSGYTSIDYIQYRTGIKMAMGSEFMHTLIFPRSSISKYNLVLANSIGLIDTDYRGEILLRFKYIWQPTDVLFLDPEKYPAFIIQVNRKKIYEKGNKIGQLVFDSRHSRISFEAVNELPETVRGEGGFGHTDK